jgi:hypothetical protein
MVCDKCEKKLTKVACPEKWKEGTEKRKVCLGSQAGEGRTQAAP